ncbi:MAG TPA: hypothetical protein VGP61_12705 [Gemmatimonadales bacterium]|jgi:hypothetical protein|nr:hypothetical protein [Gemmatimonadales bacterium]
MAGRGLTAERWFEEQSAGAPEVLREKAREYLRAVGPSGDRGGPAERLGEAARAALDAVVSQSGDRSVALDLLAADALVTLALKARARENPAGLARFAAELLA